ncbi:hypothetical protein ACQVPJ_24590 [Bacillus mycoides]|uniref:Uncharacterized protein n=1 Tax=Bacillus cereus VD021 TaxID=1053224 RepID=R8HF73_BACCE|nr:MULTISPECIES: hypothetical protein [Bacillus cereus group]AIW88259.1 hypothetical protein bwei_5750 [Bacillus mycoides]EOO71416.1 hypothetical protein IIC_04404 [Bacillus cereus VD021]MCQ6569328.1 hypothetical protein [Bacillus mycoides]GAE43216.1 hypothetical protein BW1_082_00080 [Bacillus mycoides NBRC 101238 = DSM 11821]
MDLMYLLTDEKGLGTFKITNSISDTWIETIVSVGERLIKKDVKFRYIKVLSVRDKRIKSYVDKPLPLIGAVTTANFERMEGVPPAFRKKPTLRACKILYSFSANPVTNENPKTAPG